MRVELNQPNPSPKLDAVIDRGVCPANDSGAGKLAGFDPVTTLIPPFRGERWLRSAQAGVEE
jgi:hypothetical protein